MKNNNGKIAIAIVAMFVVALSVVGFTYAYFTAQVIGNDEANETSVKVSAGTMVINYDMGDTITGAKIVPGWKNDGKMFYDPKYSVEVENGISKISAVSTEQFGEGEGKLAAEPSVVPANYGLRAPVTFDITNTGTRDAYYKLTLENMENALDEADKVNLTYTVSAALNVAVDEDGEPVEALEDADYSDIIIDKAFGTAATATLFDKVTLGVGKANFYKIIFHYHNLEDQNQTDSSAKDMVFKATVKVTGLGEEVTNTENTTPDTTPAE